MKVSNKSIDLGLVKRVKAGDYQAFDLLVLKYQSRLISTAFKYVKDIQIAEDITQESLIKSFKSINSFREDSSFYTWARETHPPPDSGLGKKEGDIPQNTGRYLNTI
mgnify:CR=1 FL=1